MQVTFYCDGTSQQEKEYECQSKLHVASRASELWRDEESCRRAAANVLKRRQGVAAGCKRDTDTHYTIHH